jgi:hypothetical protein
LHHGYVFTEAVTTNKGQPMTNETVIVLVYIS